MELVHLISNYTACGHLSIHPSNTYLSIYLFCLVIYLELCSADVRITQFITVYNIHSILWNLSIQLIYINMIYTHTRPATQRGLEGRNRKCTEYIYKNRCFSLYCMCSFWRFLQV